MRRSTAILLTFLASSVAFANPPTTASSSVDVLIMEGIPDKPTWDFPLPKSTAQYTLPAFASIGVPEKYSPRGHVLDRSNPFVIHMTGKVALPAGEYRFLLRSRNAARLLLDGKLVAQTNFIRANASGHERVPDSPSAKEKNLTPLPTGHQEAIVAFSVSEGSHDVRLEAFVGGKRLRLDPGEVFAGIARGNESFRLLAAEPLVDLSINGWADHCEQQLAFLNQYNRQTRWKAGTAERAYWKQRHDLARKIVKAQGEMEIPQVDETIPSNNAIDHFLGKKLKKAKVKPAPLTDDLVFLRRVTLDTVGVTPAQQEIEAFEQDPSNSRRSRVIDRLLDDPRWADHWVSYWQDVLAENPGILKPTLNNTGPFRWWLLQAFRDNLPMDRFVTELVMMEGSKLSGGPAGFGMATQNDVPMAAKAHVLSKAFLGLDLQCARCHDAPFQGFKQEATFKLAAMLTRQPVKLPATSSVPLREGARTPSVTITLKPGATVQPAWPFDEISSDELPEGILREKNDPREKLAAVLTSPRNERFAQVLANRLWKRYMGWGIVEPVDDWHEAIPSHPELLQYLGRELITHDYDLKHVARLILNSHAYQRSVQEGTAVPPLPQERFFASPARRRMTAEQLVDSLFHAAGKEFLCEELTMDPEGRRPPTEMLNLGRPDRAWQMTSLSNERDRPALALPVAQSIVDLLSAYGWRDSRPNPITEREETPTPLQPLLLANGVVGTRITRLSDDSTFTEFALKAQSAESLVDAVFLQVLTRRPSGQERQMFVRLLNDGFANRIVPGARAYPRRRAAHTAAVSWSNHLSPEATKIKMELERQAREGDPPTKRLQPEWREKMEDMLWVMLNSPEFAFIP